MQRHLLIDGLAGAAMGDDWTLAPEVTMALPESSWAAFEPAPLPCAAPVIISFLAALSARLQQVGRDWPDLAAFGFWLRQRNQAPQAARMAGRAPLGVVFHLVPSNVPTVAFYSWLMALLAGNASVVRLSSRQDPEQEAMLRILAELFADPGWQAIAQRTRFIRYGHDETVTGWLSARCALRIIWGGDETIRAVRAIPLAPHAQEVVFPDRRSLALIDSRWLSGLDEHGWQRALQGLRLDCTRFNQLACASPTTLVWLGSPPPAVRQRLLEETFTPFAGDPRLAMERLVQCQMNVAGGGTDALTRLAGVTVLTQPTPSALQHIGGGTVAEWVADNWEAVQMQPWSMQTCVYLGESLSAARERLTAARGRIDRVVAPGQALAFDWFWDGIDMLSVFSRCIR
ncbi:acyl-CoA reductase [Aeromonas schubertii]|uniref:acyl-CoA reductase n=1 Tax=Aeromonas schubertii TaxID=652 RepID=UPI0010A91AD6|nr:acyl-CoA reductase [Aeromonas schubertii]